MIQNLYQFKPALPFSPGGEVAGIILSVGDEVKNLKPGQRVLALSGWGGFAEEVAEKVDPYLKMKQSTFFNALIIQID